MNEQAAAPRGKKRNTGRTRRERFRKDRRRAAADANDANQAESSAAVNTPISVSSSSTLSQGDENPGQELPQTRSVHEEQVLSSTRSDRNAATIGDHGRVTVKFPQGAIAQSVSRTVAPNMPRMFGLNYTTLESMPKPILRPMVMPALPPLDKIPGLTPAFTDSVVESPGNITGTVYQGRPIDQEGSEDDIVISVKDGGVVLTSVKKGKSREVNLSQPSDAAKLEPDEHDATQAPGHEHGALPIRPKGRKFSRPPPLMNIDDERFRPKIELVKARAGGDSPNAEHTTSNANKTVHNNKSGGSSYNKPLFQTSTATDEMDSTTEGTVAHEAVSDLEQDFENLETGQLEPTKKKKKKRKNKSKKKKSTTTESAPVSANTEADSAMPTSVYAASAPLTVNPEATPSVAAPALVHKDDEDVTGAVDKIRVTKPASAPVSPEDLIFQEWRRLPRDVRYAQVTHKEKLAIQTIETAAEVLIKEDEKQANRQYDTETSVASPENVPMIDRMAVTFARAMARARHEVDNGQFSMNNTGSTNTRRVGGAVRTDVMSSMEVEAFCLGMAEVTDPGRGGRVVMRRYWRLTQGLESGSGVGGVIATSQQYSRRPAKISLGQKSYREAAEEAAVDGVLIAEVEVDRKGCWVAGEWNARGLSGWKRRDDFFGPGRGLLLG